MVRLIATLWLLAPPRAAPPCVVTGDEARAFHGLAAGFLTDTLWAPTRRTYAAEGHQLPVTPGELVREVHVCRQLADALAADGHRPAPRRVIAVRLGRLYLVQEPSAPSVWYLVTPEFRVRERFAIPS